MVCKSSPYLNGDFFGNFFYFQRLCAPTALKKLKFLLNLVTRV